MIEQIAKERVLVKNIRRHYLTTPKPAVSIITPTAKAKYIDNIFANYRNSYYPFKELIVILNNNNLNIEDYRIKAIGLDNVRIYQLDESYTLGECVNYGIEQSKFNYISKMDDDDYYAPNFLIDLINVFNYTDAQITGKATYFVYFEDDNTLGIFSKNYENRYHYTVAGSTLLFKKEVFQKIKFRNLDVAEDNYFLSDSINAGFKIFSSDKYNYVAMRHKNLFDHTWRVSHAELLDNYVEKFPDTIDFTSLATV
jgi:glycosyltransferase involved in cell wall biosynthesis